MEEDEQEREGRRTAGKLADVGKHVLKAIGELESVDVAEPELDVDVNDEFREPEDLATQMDCGAKDRGVSQAQSPRAEQQSARRTGVSETRLLALLGRQRLDRFEVHVLQ